MNGEDELPPILISLLAMRRMVATNPGLELLGNPSRVMSITTVSVGVGARLAKAWEMML